MKIFTIGDFFTKNFEKISTILLIDNPSYFSPLLMKEYVNQLVKYNLQDYINYLLNNPIENEITSRDVTQLSSIDDCTINMCRMMLKYNNKGFTLIEIATNLHEYMCRFNQCESNIYKDNTIALLKYGENQVKTACQMGLAVIKDETWYLSGIGYIFNDLSVEEQNKYLAINMLRDPFYSKVILSLLERDTNIRDYMSFLSESTQIRRTPSCMRVLSFFIKQCELESIKLNSIINNK